MIKEDARLETTTDTLTDGLRLFMGKSSKSCKKKKIELDLTDDEFLFIAKRAHKLDITFNEMVELILWKALLDEVESWFEEEQNPCSRTSRTVTSSSGPINEKAKRRRAKALVRLSRRISKRPRT